MNLANVAVDDAVVEKWLEVKKHNSPYKCMCMKLDKKNTKVILDEDENCWKMKDDENTPDMDDYENRKKYEEDLFEEYVRDHVIGDPNTVKFFTWEFYFQTATDKNNKTRIGLVSWVSDDCSKIKSKMVGASASAEIVKKLQLPSASAMVKDAADMKYNDIASRITQDFKN